MVIESTKHHQMQTRLRNNTCMYKTAKFKNRVVTVAMAQEAYELEKKSSKLAEKFINVR